MLEWIARGLHKGIVTTGYPRRSEPAPDGFRGRVEVVERGAAPPDLEAVCPTGAIRVDAGSGVSLDRGRCILCGACVEAAPDRFRFVGDYVTAARRRNALVAGDTELGLEEVRRPLGDQVRALKRSLHIRHVDAGSDGAEEWEIAALTNPYYDMQRLGLYFTLAPRHADILLVTGGVTPSMEEPLRRAYEAMPAPKAVVAAGTDACSGGFATAEMVAGGVDRVLPVDVYVPGSPPSPIALLHGLLLAVGVLTEEAAA
jgi:Ni,Fe-hydrogenase III small subunit/ferredoxin